METKAGNEHGEDIDILLKIVKIFLEITKALGRYLLYTNST